MASELLPRSLGHAVLSEDGLYRYELRRQWDENQPVTWVMLNPSTADADIDDPTIRRCMAFSRSWGYGGIRVVNLFAYRATDPKALVAAPSRARTRAGRRRRDGSGRPPTIRRRRSPARAARPDPPRTSHRPDDPTAPWVVTPWQRGPTFLKYGPLVQDMGFPAALAAQDGIEHMPNLREQLEACDCLFLAGSTRWKTSLAAERVATLARSLGKWVHMGRVNGYKRIERARAMGCLSVDGNYVAFGPDINGPRVCHWLTTLAANPMLPGVADYETPSLPVHKEATDRWR